MAAGGTLALSVSGGKDGQAMTNALLPIIQERGWKAFLLHMDLGRAEWPQTPAHVERIAERTGLSLVVVKRPQGDLVQEIEDRMVKLAGTDKPFWPSSASRYCTADQKRAQADKVYRNLESVVEQQEATTGKPFWPSSANRYCTSHHKTNQADKVYRQHEIIISCEGIRAQESPARAKKPQLQIREQITAKALQGLPIMDALAYRSLGQRLALTWFPILDWELEDVWQAMGTSSAELERRRELYRAEDDVAALDGWPGHPAYVFGNVRVSCAICMLAIDGDIRNGAKHHPELYRTYRQMEVDSGFTFKNGRSLADITGANDE